MYFKWLLTRRLLKIQLFRKLSLVTEGGGHSFIERGKKIDMCLGNNH